MRVVRSVILLFAILIMFVAGCALEAAPSGNVDEGPEPSNDVPASQQHTEDEAGGCASLQGSVALPADRTRLATAIRGHDCLDLAGDLTVGGGERSVRPLRRLETLRVDGRVVVRTEASVEDLSMLGGLVNVEGDLVIRENAGLTCLEGLDKLMWVGGDLTIADNPKLNHIRGPSSLQQIRSDLKIERNPQLTVVSGFDGLLYIAEYNREEDRPDPAGGFGGTAPTHRDFGPVDPHLIVTDNPKLEEIRGFASLTDIDGDIRLQRNDALHTVEGFGNLEFMTGRLVVADQPNLADIDALARPSCLREVHLENTALDDLSALSDLWEIGRLTLVDNAGLSRVGPLKTDLRLRGPVEIRGNGALTSLAGLASVEVIERGWTSSWEMPTAYEDSPNAECVPEPDVDAEETNSNYVSLEDNDALKGLGELDWRRIDGDLIVRGNDTLSGLAGLDQLEEIEGDLILENNDALAAIESFDRLIRLRGSLVIAEHDELVRLEAFGSVDYLEGNLRIEANPALTKVSGFDALRGTNDLTVVRNGVTDLDGLAGVRRVDDLRIADNPKLDRLEDLVSLEEVEGKFSIENNARLASLGRFEALESIANGLVVQDNPRLPNCQAESLASSVEASYALIEANAACK